MSKITKQEEENSYWKGNKKNITRMTARKWEKKQWKREKEI